MEQLSFPRVGEDAAELIQSYYDNLTTAYGGIRPNGQSVLTGFFDLDWVLGGFHPKDLIILGGVPIVGKSDFALNIALNVSFKFNQKVALFSLQSSRLRTTGRILMIRSGVTPTKYVDGQLHEADVKALEQAAKEISWIPLFIRDINTPHIGFDKLRSEAQSLSDKHPLDLLLIDSMQRVTAPRPIHSQKSIPLPELLKSLAQELNIPVVATSQLTRAIDKRFDHIPQLSDLMGGRTVEDMADVVLLMHRSEIYSDHMEDTTIRGMVNLAVAKNRNGPNGVASLGFDERIGRFFHPELDYSLDHKEVLGFTP